MGVLPDAPAQRRLLGDRRVRAGEQPSVGGREVTIPFRGRHSGGKGVPLPWEHAPHVAGDPLGLEAPPSGHRREHHGGHPVGVPLGVSERQGHTPRDAGDDPPLDAQMVAQQLDVPHQMVGGVGGQVGGGAVREWPRPATAALVEQHRPVLARIEETSIARRATGSRTAVQPHDRCPRWIANGLPVELVSITNGKQPRVVRLDRRIPLSHRRSGPSRQPSGACLYRWAA